MEFPYTPSPELMQKANLAKTPEELQAIAGESGMELTARQAQDYFAQLHKTGELSDDELDNVSGGCGGDSGPDPLEISATYLNYMEPEKSVCQYFTCEDCGMGQPLIKTFMSRSGEYRPHSAVIPGSTCVRTCVCLSCKYNNHFLSSRSDFYYCTHPANRKK